MSELSRYVVDQIKSLTSNKKHPVISDVIDRGTKVSLVFNVGNEKVSVTASDLFLASLNEKLQNTLTLPRQKFISTLTKEITAGIREELTNESEKIDFSQPVSDEVKEEALKIAKSIINSDKVNFITTVGYINCIGTPIFQYQLLKYLIPMMEDHDITVSDKMREALKNPQEYLNPYYIAKRFDESLDYAAGQEVDEEMYNED